MKKLLFGLGCLLSSAHLATAHLLQNGWFEDGLDGWATQGNNVFSISNYYANEHQLCVSETADGGTIYQDVPAWSNCCYTFSIRGYSYSSNTGTLIQVKLDFLSAEGTPLLSLSTSPTLEQSTNVTLMADSPPGAVTIRPSLFIGPSTTNSCSWWDNADLSYVSVTLTTLYVAASSTNPVPPFSDWSTAATSIQAAVDVAQDGATVMVGDGTYASGASRSGDGYGVVIYGHYSHYDWYWDQQLNRLVIDKSVTVRSLNGPEHTILLGDSTTRCAYLKSGASLIGFTLQGGRAQVEYEGCYGGGGAMLHSGASLEDCVVFSNSAVACGGGVCCWNGGRVEHCTIEENTAHDGGGLYTFVDYWPRGTNVIENCVLIRNHGIYGANAQVNSAVFRNCLIAEGKGGYGAGIDVNGSALVENCTIVSNTAWAVGGIVSGGTNVIVRNSIIYGNTHDTNYAGPLAYNWNSTQMVFTSCCTIPLPLGAGNIDSPPMLKEGTYELRYGSPCIDAGMNLDGVTNDLLGVARPIDGNGDGSTNVDMGAYEYDPSTADSDDDGVTDYHECLAGSGPYDNSSCLRFLCPILSGDTDSRTVRWQSVDGKRYNLLRATELRSGFSPIATGIDATPPENSFTDSSAPLDQPLFYQVQLAE